ncbi:MAG: amidase [Hyphomicrobiaceae bacterium]
MPESHCWLSASEAAKEIAAGKLTSEALARSCLERIAEREPSVAAWAYLDPSRVISQARACDERKAKGPLHGVPIAYKDIIDTADMPTAYGSRVFQGHRPSRDAECVASTKAAGAVAMGKTVTTEFAFRYPGVTSNPHNRLHTPGGSSSGSAAAVADGMVPLALGTQTAGSVIRPAAYCGVFGLKPTFNSFSFVGVSHLAESFDTLGCMARTLDDIALLRSVLAGCNFEDLGEGLDRAPNLAFCRTPYWEEATPDTQELVSGAARRLASAGAKVVDLDLKHDGKALLDATWVINNVEGQRAIGGIRDRHPDGVSQAIQDLVDEGRAIGYTDYAGAMRRIDHVRQDLDRELSVFDAIITPSAVGEAPQGLDFTGPIPFNFLWTATGMPALTIPAFTGPNQLPIGLQLVARRHSDDLLLQVARWVERRLGTLAVAGNGSL